MRDALIAIKDDANILANVNPAKRPRCRSWSAQTDAASEIASSYLLALVRDSRAAKQRASRGTRLHC